MKIYGNILSQDLLDHCVNEILEMSGQLVWGSSSLRWDDDIKEGITGSCLQCYVPGETQEKLIAELSEHFLDATEYKIQYYIWQKNSGIAHHNDNHHIVGATIYLNENWNKNHGGLFVWYDEDDVVMRALCPTQNMIVINDEHQRHFVTQISPLCDEPRYTIQLWID